MPLTQGSRLGPYEILSPLGAGGMGEVYRARDTKLDREVAIKVLPERLAEDSAALERFEREAKAVAALSHPNILGIYELGRDGGATYAVTELLTGETLRQRLEEGPLPQRKALAYGLQIAHGLAAAHEKGIVHRDLKPENIFLTTDGRAKILDFGLAKVAPKTSEDTQSPTVAASTEPGTVMGTVGYMSPEQVRGKPADARTDIFSFGTVLYEMISGQRAFRGDSAAETMAAIAQKDPPKLAEDTGMFPPAVERLLRHCLEKRPEERFDTAHDLAFALEGVLGAAITSGAQAKLEPRPAVRRGRLIAAALMIALAAAGFVLGRLTRRNRPAAQSAQPVRFVRLTDTPGVESEPSLSPDGKSVVYVSDAGSRLGLYLLRVGGRNPVALTADSSVDDWQPAFSPDGERIAFRSEREGGGIFVMGSTGESVKRVTDFGFNPSWSPDGKEIVVANGAFLFPSDRGGRIGGLIAVNLETGKKREVSSAGDCMQPSWSPHGKRIAYWGLRGTGGQRDLWTVAADGSEAKTDGVEVTHDAPLDWSPTWSPDGKYLYFASNRGGTMNLWRIAIDEATGRVLGEPEPITTPSLWSGELSFSRDGTKLAYGSLDWRSTLVKVGFDPKTEAILGAPVPIMKSTQPIRDHQVSADGQWIAFMQTGSQEDLFVVRTDGSQFRRLTDDTYRDRGPSWSPDGKLIAFYSDRSGSYQVWTIRPDGSGLERLTQTQGSLNYPVWSPDGRRIATAGIPGSWYLIDLASGGSPRPARLMPMINKEEGFWPLSWSPDGQRLAGVVIQQNGTLRAVATYSFPTGLYDVIDVGRGGFWRVPAWLADSRRLLVRDRWGIFLLDTATKKMRRLISIGGYGIGLSVGVSRDNRSITYTETGTEGDIWLAEFK